MRRWCSFHSVFIGTWKITTRWHHSNSQCARRTSSRNDSTEHWMICENMCAYVMWSGVDMTPSCNAVTTHALIAFVMAWNIICNSKIECLWSSTNGWLISPTDIFKKIRNIQFGIIYFRFLKRVENYRQIDIDCVVDTGCSKFVCVYEGRRRHNNDGNGPECCHLIGSIFANTYFYLFGRWHCLFARPSLRVHVVYGQFLTRICRRQRRPLKPQWYMFAALLVEICVSVDPSCLDHRSARQKANAFTIYLACSEHNERINKISLVMCTLNVADTFSCIKHLVLCRSVKRPLTKHINVFVVTSIISILNQHILPSNFYFSVFHIILFCPSLGCCCSLYYIYFQFIYVIVLATAVSHRQMLKCQFSSFFTSSDCWMECEQRETHKTKIM